MTFPRIQSQEYLQRSRAIWRRFAVAIAGSCLVPLLLAAPASAAGGLSQGYTTSENNLAPGTLMGLAPNDNTAYPAVEGKDYQLLGLVASEPLIALNNGDHKVQVVVSGSAKALVSDINGTVHAGDKITVSPITGIGMKATDPGQIVGVAQDDFETAGSKSVTITDKTGKSEQVTVGTVSMQVSINYYAGTGQGALASIVPPVAVKIADGIAGQAVSPLRVLVGLLSLLLGFVTVVGMLQSGIKANIIAVGRNPMAKKDLRKELIDVLLTALGVLLLSTIITYVTIKF